MYTVTVSTAGGMPGTVGLRVLASGGCMTPWAGRWRPDPGKRVPAKE